MENSKINIKKAIKLMGKKPLNPIGTCFDSSLHILLNPKINKNTINLKNIKLCHGIGIATAPGQEGLKMAHAWLEFTNKDGINVVIDTTWGIVVEVNRYRQDLKLNYVIEYTPEEAFENWKKGTAPWDEKIKNIIKENKNRRFKKAEKIPKNHVEEMQSL